VLVITRHTATTLRWRRERDRQSCALVPDYGKSRQALRREEKAWAATFMPPCC